MHCWPTRPGVARCLGRIVVATLAASVSTLATAACDEPAGQLINAEGLVERRATETSPWQVIEVPATLCAGDMIAVRPPGRAAVQLRDGSLLRLDENSTLHVLAASRERQTELGLVEGFLHVITRMRKHFSVTTPFINALVEGTEFSVASRKRRAQVVVESGTVRTENAHGSVVLPAGAAIEAIADAGPRQIEVRPLDALRWAIHYPQIVWHDDDALARLPAAQADALRAAQAQMAAARYGDALRLLDGVGNGPEATSTRVSLLLALGRVDDAVATLDRVQHEGDPALAALTALIQVARNQPQGSDTARQAAAAGPDSAAARLALSHARQARGALDEALAAARDATRLAPQNPFAWARRAELELSLTLTAAARRSLAELTARAPQLPRAKTLLGFAELIDGATGAARQRFGEALAADDSDPLAYFGQGLAAVRSGDYEDGRRDIERAVLLDPGNAELRAYLARVYVEEDRSALAGKELELARRLDPASPTPWQFDALRKLRDNDPVGALADGRRAIELNDNRAVLRSPHLLDIDRAAHSASLGPAYSRLGFDLSLRRAAIDALFDDPIGASGHRLLADALTLMPRHQAARTSASLKARLRQPLGRAPLPQHVVAQKFPIAEGSRALSPEEGTDLFLRGTGHLFVTAVAGNQETRAASIAAMRAAERAEVSLNHYHYQRSGLDGFPDTRISGTHLGMRFAPSATHTVLAELSTAELKGGPDVPGLLQDSMPPLVDNPLNRDTARLAFRHAPGTDSETLIVASSDRLRERSEFDFGPVFGSSTLSTTAYANTVEILHSSHLSEHRLTLGAGHYRENSKGVQIPSFGFPPMWARSTHTTIYGRVDYKHSNKMTVHVAATHDDLDDMPPASATRAGGKIGLSYDLAAPTRLQLAIAQGIKGPKYYDQTILPTDFAGFNQTFDDFTGTRWRSQAISVDHRLGNGGRIGAGASHRLLDVPNAGCGFAVGCRTDWDEWLYEAYVEKPLTADIALSLNWIVEKLDFTGDASDSPTLPSYVRTELVPIGIWWHLTDRLSSRIEATHLRQHAMIDPGGGIVDRTEDVWLANVHLSHEEPRQRFGFSIDVHNLFDRRFRFQNTDWNGSPRTPLFYADRTVLLQLTMRY
ncbi:MAG: FecR domain-containing protein [Rhodocyclaceae bacterium]|nr:FecR domain-containing protein [Rhodocyclaceae bacterium]